MKTLITLLLLCTVATTTAQYKLLTIYKSDQSTDYIVYPPGTDFKLTNAEGKVVATAATLDDTYQIDQPHVLVVFPDYKETSDRYELTQGKLMVKDTSSKSKWGAWGRKPKLGTSTSNNYNNDGVTATSTLTESKTVTGQKNIAVVLNNGIRFEYLDGKVKATYNEEVLPIEGKYIITSEVGVAKISFNPKSGRMYWIFESN